MQPPPSENAELAKQFLELWQQQFAASLTNPETMRGMVQWLAWLQQQPPAQGPQSYAPFPAPFAATASGSAGPSTTAVSDGYERVAELLGRLERRMERLEQRLDALEPSGHPLEERTS